MLGAILDKVLWFIEIVSRIFRKIFYYHLIVEYYPTVTSA